MISLRAAAELHKRQFDAMVDGNGVLVELQFPPEKATGATMAAKAFGQKTAEETIDPARSLLLKGVWSNDYIRADAVVGGDVAEAIASMTAKANPLDGVLRLKLADVLLPGATSQGQSVFDTCKYVLYQGVYYRVVDTKRSGLPPIGPYILWVGLVKLEKR